MFKPIFTAEAPAPIGPYSQAVAINGLVFLSGQIPLSPLTGEVVGSTAAEQVVQVLANLCAVLEASGSRPSQVVKTTIFLTDLADFAAVNAAYGKVFGVDGPAPARSTVQVVALPKGVKVEIEAVALVTEQ